jgi:aminomuconate-semialdehyde/2-hydroxymuconate-6-semialdehyde dehydrogenase
MIESLKNYIGGELRDPLSNAYLDVYEPATGKVYARVPDSGAEDIAQAVSAAERAFPSWSATPVSERSRILRRIAEGIERELETLARAESVDSGKPLALARRLDIPRAAQNFAFFADAITQHSSEAHFMDGMAINYTLRDPLGVVGCISPWNLPLYLFSWKIAPALASGCCVVAKPSEVTPRSAYLLSKICMDAGLPAGVLNIVHGSGARTGAALVAHPGLKAISFTGSTRTGAEIARLAAPTFKKLSLEMGGKNATMVFSDCDFDATVEGVLRSAFTNQGQICLCGSRIFVERPLYERFKSALVERTRALKQGDPLEAGTDQGAIVSREHFEKVMACLQTARQEGGHTLTGGNAAKVPGRCENGWFIEPTLIEGLSPQCQTNQEEIFGPVATLIPFDTEEEAITGANSTRYGLAASVWTRDVSRAHRVSHQLHAGVIWVNCWLVRDLRTPFGGMKDSGVGREGGVEALRFFTEAKNVCISIPGAVK